MFAKLKNGILDPAPSVFYEGNRIIVNPDEAFLQQKGYKMVVNTKRPDADEGFYYEPVWEEKDDTILQTWEIHEYPEATYPDDFWEMVGNILIGKEE